MAVETYSRVFNFQNQQALTPASPIPAQQLDAELNAVKITFDALISALAQIQRDDGALANESVGYDQLKPELSLGFAPPHVWTTSTVYETVDAVFHETSFYRCLVRHTSGVFVTDLAAQKWQLVYDFAEIFSQLGEEVALDGWSPVFAIEANGEERILKVVDWVGGDGTKPDVDKYVGASGLVDAIGDGVDVRGATGAAATISVGTVGTVSAGDPATVTNSGTSSAAVFDFEIPEGDPGADGATWHTGATDPAGGLGANGDFYLQTGTGATGVLGDVWLKAAGTWSIETNIRGASGAGTGDVVGPSGGVTAGEVAVFADTTGKEIEGSGVAIADILVVADIGSSVQAWDAQLDSLSAASANGVSLVTAANYAAMRALLDLEPNTDFYAPGGTDVAIADGGTGASDAATAFANLKQAATESATGVVELATSAEVAAGSDTVRAITPATLHANAIKQGVHEIWVDASAMKAAASNGASIQAYATGEMMVAAFDASTDESVYFKIGMPKGWNNGTVSFIPYWTNAAGLTTETVSFNLEGRAMGNDDVINTTFGTPQESEDTWLAQNDLHIGPESAAITIGNTPAENDLVSFRLYRDVSEDNLTGDALLLGIKLRITIDLPTDV
jgi:hypothetical protein